MGDFVDKEFNAAQANITDLRAVILALKMATLTSVEEYASTEIKQLIKNLPSAETMNDLGDSPDGLKDVRDTVGYILGLINSYGQRNAQSKARYQSKTNLPPRYKVMDWRSDMEKEAKSFVKELVRISSVADGKGDSDIASKSIVCAKAIRSEEAKEEDIAELASMLRSAGYEKESDFVREAQVGSWMKGLWEGAKNVGGNIAATLLDPARLEKTKAKLNQIVQSIQPELQYVQQVIPKTKDPAMQAQMQGIAQVLGEMSQKGQEAVATLGQAQQTVQADPNAQAQPAQAQPVADPNAQVQDPNAPAQPVDDGMMEIGNVMYKNQQYTPKVENGLAIIDTPDGQFYVDESSGQRVLRKYDPKQITNKVPLNQAKPTAPMGEITEMVNPQGAPISPVKTPPNAHTGSVKDGIVKVSGNKLNFKDCIK